MISGKILNEQFVVMAKFEYRQFEVHQVLIRSEARILRRGTQIPEDLSNRKANALIVMQNPGSCLPKEELKDEWQESIPDKTQYQLMRLMERMNWDELIIVNLSDMCEGDSFEFKRLLKICELQNVPNSRYAKNIQDFIDMTELVDYVIYGWGSRPEAKRLAMEHGFLPIEGLKLNGKEPKAYWNKSRDYPRHPFPYLPNRCEEWLNEMTAVLKEPKEVSIGEA
ncbi:DUF1643 domain-containing protein [Psychrobacillus sp. FSL W7-1493]|uniref:DUF1643 domain-containing protein n=1 Tax=Psychrobacillus sp. FSL W7-1493 TaxID=2921552 RepID=UPI0030FBD413